MGTNLAYAGGSNTSFDTDAAAWTLDFGGGGGISRITSAPTPHDGTGALKAIVGGAGFYLHPAAGIAVPPSTVHVVSLWCYIPASNGVLSAKPYITWGTVADGSDPINHSASDIGTEITTTGSWVRAEVTGTSRSNTAWCGIVLGMIGSTDSVVYFDSYQLEVGSSASPYNEAEAGSLPPRGVTVGQAVARAATR